MFNKKLLGDVVALICSIFKALWHKLISIAYFRSLCDFMSIVHLF